MTQIGFDYNQAHEALDEFLNGEKMTRWIGTEDGKGVAAHIVTDEEWGKVRNGYHHWLESQEVRDEDIAAEHGYKPWRHSPLATENRLLPYEPLLEPLARMFFGKPHEELDEDQERRVRVAAMCALLRVTLDPDGQGAVPIMAVCHDRDEPGEGLRWQIAFVTKVPGLYVRVTSNGFFGEEWGIVTGSGYRIASGWHSRDGAAQCCEALGRTLPNADWMRLAPAGFTPKAQAAITGVIRKYHQWGVKDNEPEPEVMADEIPAAEEPAEPVAAG